jgi:uncharacterized membrane protein
MAEKGETKKENREPKYSGIFFISVGIFLIIFLIWETIFGGSSWKFDFALFAYLLLGLCLIIFGISRFYEGKQNEISLFFMIVSLIIIAICVIIMLVLVFI